MTVVAKLANAANVHRSCLALLDRQGWALSIIPGPYEAKDAHLDQLSAEKDGTQIIASNALELLGLAAIHEHHHPHDGEPYWWVVKPRDPTLLHQLETAGLEQGFDSLRVRNEALWKQTLKRALADAAVDPSVSAAERLGVSDTYLARLLTETPDLD